MSFNMGCRFFYASKSHLELSLSVLSRTLSPVSREFVYFDQIPLILIYILPQLALVAQTIKNLPATQSLGWEDPLEKEMATHSSILAWRIPKDRGAWRATVHGVARVGHDLVTIPPQVWWAGN